jgi:hypothetical protein
MLAPARRWLRLEIVVDVVIAMARFQAFRHLMASKMDFGALSMPVEKTCVWNNGQPESMSIVYVR